MTLMSPRRTPLNSWHRAHGAKMTDFGGWDMPIQYQTGILEEHLATRRAGGLFDVSHMGRFRFRGGSPVPFLQRVLTSNAAGLEPWNAHYTLIPTATGGLLDDAYLYRFGEHDYLLVVNASNRERDWAHLVAEARRSGTCELVDETEAVAMIAVQGPRSRQVLESLLEGGSLPEPFHNRLSEATFCGTRTLAGRTGYTGEPIGFELFLPAERAEPLWARILEAGGALGVVPVGLGARDTLRLEAGMPLYGHELGPDPAGGEMPAFGCPLAGTAISFSPLKGDFIGREALLKQFDHVKRLRRGEYTAVDVLRRQIRPLALTGPGVARAGDEVFRGELKVGHVTSGTVTPYWKFEGPPGAMKISDGHDRRSIALAYVDAERMPDDEIEIAVRGRRIPARIVKWHGRSEAPPFFHAIPVGMTPHHGHGTPVGAGAAKALTVLEKALANHEWRQRRAVNLIPSEMTPSPLVRLLQVADPVGRYAEHKELLAAFEQEVFYYQGVDFIAWVEERLAEEMSEFLGCPLVEARIVSGQMANMTVFSAMVDWRNRADRRREPERIRLVLNHHIARGGHLSSQPMGALRDLVAKDPATERYAVVSFPVRRDNPYRVDLDETAALLERVDPELVIFGKSMILHREPVAEVKKMLEGRQPRPVLMYDMAHVLGLVGPHFQRPFAEGADIVTGSTHKTFFGTQRGVVGANFAEGTPGFDLWKAIRRRAFPGMVSNHHLGTLLGLLFASVEMNAFKESYQPQVMANAKAFARALAAVGVRVEGDPSIGYTETHQVIVNVGYAAGGEIANNLERANIVVNYQATPSDESFTASSALRLGVAEMTRFGMKERDFAELAPVFAEAMQKGAAVGEQVARFRERFLEMRYCFDGAEFEGLKRRLAATI